MQAAYVEQSHSNWREKQDGGRIPGRVCSRPGRQGETPRGAKRGPREVLATASQGLGRDWDVDVKGFHHSKSAESGLGRHPLWKHSILHHKQRPEQEWWPSSKLRPLVGCHAGQHSAGREWLIRPCIPHPMGS